MIMMPDKNMTTILVIVMVQSCYTTVIIVSSWEINILITTIVMTISIQKR